MSSDNMPEPEKKEEVDPLMIILLGKTGVGKSSSGNTILGKQVFESDLKLSRVTKYCEREDGTVGDGTGEDVPVAVIDTPGLFERNCKDEENVQFRILQCSRLLEPGPHAFALVLPIGRMTQEDHDTYTLIEKMFGPRVWDYTIVLFTHGDRLEGKTINDIITESDEIMRNFIRKCSGGFHVFNNKNPDDVEQVATFVEQIQILVALNGGSRYSEELYPDTEREIRGRQRSILAERDREIRDKEEALLQRYNGDELEEMRKDLWRKAEKEARLAAEKHIGRGSNRITTMFFTFLLLLVAVLLNYCGLGGQMSLLAIICICTFSKVFPLSSRKKPRITQ